MQIDMQRGLDALMDWGSTWGMKFNAEKCNIMRVSRSRKPLQHFYSLGNEILQEVSDAKYLLFFLVWKNFIHIKTKKTKQGNKIQHNNNKNIYIYIYILAYR